MKIRKYKRDSTGKVVRVVAIHKDIPVGKSKDNRLHEDLNALEYVVVRKPKNG